MTPRLGRRSGAAAALVTALVTALLVLTPTGPASAADPGPVITIDQPVANATSDSATVTVSGSVATDLALYQIKQVVLSVGDKPPFSPPCGNDPPCAFTWKVTLPLNGPYQLKVTASEKTFLLGTDGPTSTQTRAFAVAAPPQKPVLSPPRVTEGRAVELTWSRNTEPDMLYYAVFRKDPAGSKFLQIGGKVAQPASGPSVTFTDTTTSFNAGDYAYQVVAVRKGASGTAATEKSSDPSVAAVAAVPAPPRPRRPSPSPAPRRRGRPRRSSPGRPPASTFPASSPPGPRSPR